MEQKKQNAGRQAGDPGEQPGFPEGTVSRPKPPGDPICWIYLLHGLAGKPLRFRIGDRWFQLSSDTIYLLEETGPETSAGGDLFTYVCGTPEAVVKTLQDLWKGPGPARLMADSWDLLRGMAN